MNARVRVRCFGTVVAALCIACCIACHDGISGSRHVDLEIDSSLTIWANLMPTFPPPPDRIHALVPAEFHNLSDEAVVVEPIKIVVKTLTDGQVLHVFRLEQMTDWSGYLPPGGSGGGEWRKAESLLSGRLVCDEPVAGTLWITAAPVDGGHTVVHRIELDPTTLACVY